MIVDFDNISKQQELDTLDMYAEIHNLPNQLQQAWQLGQHQQLPKVDGLKQIVIAGMGGSAIGADLLISYTLSSAKVPIFLHRDYDIPAWARGKETLVVCSSHSGDTEETLSSFKAALASGCIILAISTGGKLKELALQAGVTHWQFEHHGQPRAAVGYSFGLLLALVARLGIIPSPEADLSEAIAAMRTQQALIQREVSVTSNPAKRAAGQMVDRFVSVLASDVLAPVARRWKGQISEVAKAWGQFEALPEADHNTLAGALYPQEVISRLCVLFLRAPSCHPRNQLRSDLTRKTLMLDGIYTDFYDAAGSNALAHIWTTLHFGDYTMFYLAVAYGVDPTPVDALEGFKAEMKKG